jgi:hypothetical protein
LKPRGALIPILLCATLAALSCIACKKDPERGQAAPIAAKSALEGIWRDQDDSLARAIREALDHPETTTTLDLRPFQEDAEGNDNWASLPPELWKLKKLRSLSIACFEGLDTVSARLGDLTRLETLVIDNGNGCAMNVRLPESIGKLRNLRVLRLWGAIDTHVMPVGDPSPERARFKPLPEALGELDGLEELDLGRNDLREVPPEIERLRSLRVLGLSFNDLDSVPDFVGRMPRLRSLAVDANNHIRLPLSLADREGLSVSMGGNALSFADQDSLRRAFPNIAFYFESEFDDGRANDYVDHNGDTVILRSR